MKILTQREILLFFVLLFAHIKTSANEINWQDRSDITFVYEITNKEAEKLLKSSTKDNFVLQMLHTPIDTFSTKGWANQPEKGHFIFANIIKNTVKYKYVPIIPFKIFLYNEYDRLTFQIIDTDGNICTKAKVKIRHKWSLFDTRIDFDKACLVLK